MLLPRSLIALRVQQALNQPQRRCRCLFFLRTPQRIVISTEAAHAFVSSAVEKSASLPILRLTPTSETEPPFERNL
jgi:hypothetical protein